MQDRQRVVQTRNIERSGPGLSPGIRYSRQRREFFLADDAERASFHLVQRSGGVRGGSTVALASALHAEPRAIARRQFFAAPRRSIGRGRSIADRGTRLHHHAAVSAGGGAPPFHEVSREAVRPCCPSAGTVRSKAGQTADDVSAKVLVGFAEALSGPEVVWSLADAGFQ